PYAESLSLIIAIGGITYFSIVIGELVPKTIAMNHPESLALMSVPILVPFMRLTSPFVRLLSFSTTLILGLLGVRDTGEEKISEEELIAHLKTARKQGVLDKDESSFHHNVFAFSDQSAQSIITHRSDIDWVDIHDTKEIIFKKIQKSVHSRFVVADESLDTVVGILKVKDFLEHYHEKNFSLRKNLTKPLSVALTTPAIQILNTFKKKKEYIAIVKDEHGGTEGIITLHDLIEIIVGDLPDEDEESEGNIIVSRDGHLISGKTLIYEINQYFQETVIEEDTAEYTTLSGYIMHRLERLPRTGEVISTEAHDFEVVDMDAMRIDKVLLTKKTESGEES
ncbi:HlyC/CorC family transporter, partial [Candidatus Gracilibacteria bacterium]|nr:HlyC/CorC family transporter [Candidatus Gracilibacteria bacterium]